jgi:hypothetical protein
MYTDQKQTQPQGNAKQQQLKIPRQRLQITAGSSKGSDSPSQIFFRSDSTKPNQSTGNYDRFKRGYDRDRNVERAWNLSYNYNQSRAQGAYADSADDSYQAESIDNTENDLMIMNVPQNTSQQVDHVDDNKDNLDSSEHLQYSYFQDEYGYHVVNVTIAAHKYRRCKAAFSFNNKLHAHLRLCRSIKIPSVLVVDAQFFTCDIVVSSAKSDMTRGLVFRSWHFCIFKGVFPQPSKQMTCVSTRVASCPSSIAHIWLEFCRMRRYWTRE